MRQRRKLVYTRLERSFSLSSSSSPGRRRREDVIIWQQTGSTWPYSSHYIIVINFSSSSLPLSFSRETLLYATCQTVTAQKSEADALSLSMGLSSSRSVD